jgi:hypothetical protein
MALEAPGGLASTETPPMKAKSVADMAKTIMESLAKGARGGKRKAAVVDDDDSDGNGAEAAPKRKKEAEKKAKLQAKSAKLGEDGIKAKKLATPSEGNGAEAAPKRQKEAETKAELQAKSSKLGDDGVKAKKLAMPPETNVQPIRHGVVTIYTSAAAKQWRVKVNGERADKAFSFKGGDRAAVWKKLAAYIAGLQAE